MTRRFMTATTILLTLAMGLGGLTLAAPAEKKAAKDSAAEMSPEMEAYMKLAIPGEHHKHLATTVGSWATTVKMWTEPGKPPTESTGTMESHWMLGGRFVESIYKGEFMDQPFEGRSFDGYDNGAGMYTSTWADTFGTMSVASTGSCEKQGKVRTMVGEFEDPLSGQSVKNRGVTTVIDADTYKYESYAIDAQGNEFKQMELIAKRRG